MTLPLNELPAPPPEKDRSGGQAGDHPSTWSELRLDGRLVFGKKLPPVAPLPPIELEFLSVDDAAELEAPRAPASPE